MPIRIHWKKPHTVRQQTNQITGNKRWWSLFAVMITTFFASANQTVVSTVVPTIIQEMQGFSLYAWVFSAYMLTSAVTVPIVGKLSDTYGRRPFYLFGLIVFGVASILCGRSNSIQAFVVARAIQGLGAGAMISMPRATIGDIFSPKDRGRWMGILGAVYGLSSMIAPAIGGWLTASFSWRIVFYINLPFALLAGVVVFFALPSVNTTLKSKIDWFGSTLFIVGIGLLLVGLTDTGLEQVNMTKYRPLILVSSLLVMTLFFLVERKVKDPLLSPHLFKNRIFSLSLTISFFLSMVMFGSLLFMPLFLQGVQGLDAKKSGLVLSAMMVSHVIGSLFSGIMVSKLGKYKRIAITSGFLILGGAVVVSRIRTDTDFLSIMIRMAALGFGTGSLTPILNLSVQNAFPYTKMGIVNATQQFATSMGGVIASPLLGLIMTTRFQESLNQNLPHNIKRVISEWGDLDPNTLLTTYVQEDTFRRLRQWGIGQEHALEFVEGVKSSLNEGIHYVFIAAIVFAICCCISILFLPDSSLKGIEYFSEKEDGSESVQK